jgi:hypothetical protein
MRLRHQIAAGRSRKLAPEHSIPAMRRISDAVFALLTGIPTVLSAQAVADSGVFVVRHGGDTVATERFIRIPAKLEGTLAILNAKRTSHRYTAVVAPDGTLPLIEVTVREGVDTGRVKARIVQRARVIFKEDSAAVDLSFALLEQAVRRTRMPNRSSQVPFFNLGGGQTLKARISPLGSDSLKLDIGDIRFHLRVDGAGRILGGRIPVQDVVVERR